MTESPSVLLDALARKHPRTTVAHLADAGCLSYGEWRERSRDLAAALAADGVAAGDRVALLFEQEEWLDFLVAYTATLRLGATVVSPPTGPATVARLALADSVAASLVIAGREAPAVAPGGGAAVMPFGSASRPPNRVRLALPDPVGVDPASCAEILFTSGTTGEPKPVRCSYADIAAVPPYQQGTLAVDEVRAVGFYPVGSTASQGLLQQMLRPHAYWGTGFRVWNFSAFHPRTFYRCIERSGANVLRLTPALAALLVDHIGMRAGRYDTTGVRWIKVSAAYAGPDLLAALQRAFPRAQVTNIYGLTEGGRACLRMVYGVDDPASLGRPVPGTEVDIRDSDGRPVPVGDVGEIWLRSVIVRPSPAVPRAVTTEGGWVPTGDLGRLGADGTVYLAGRAKELINVGGAKVSPQSVEQLLRSHPDVGGVAAFAIPHEVLGEAVGVAVVRRGGSEVSESDLVTFASSRGRAIEVPRRVVFVDEIPLTAIGKVDKQALLAVDRTRSD